MVIVVVQGAVVVVEVGVMKELVLVVLALKTGCGGSVDGDREV